MFLQTAHEYLHLKSTRGLSGSIGNSEHHVEQSKLLSVVSDIDTRCLLSDGAR